MDKRSVIFMGIAFPLLLLFGYVKTTSERKASDQYFKDLNLNLTGVVSDVQTVTNGNGLIFVDIKKSSIKDYDVRNTGRYYYCVIHNGKAEIMEGTTEIRVGDSISIDCNKNYFRCLRRDSVVVNRRLHLDQFDLVFNKIKQIHRL